MGDLSAMSSIERVLEQHGEEIREEWTREVPGALAGIFSRVILRNDGDAIQVEWEFKNGETLAGPCMDIDILAERFPDCEVVY